MPANDGTFLLRAEGSRVSPVRDGAPDVRLRAYIADLSSFFVGAVPLKELVRLGGAELSDLSYMRDVQSALGWDERPRNYTYF
ncbi:hypothetical protein B5F39_04870 [Cloacibacillus sp. An23]|nr:hypothetical protein B5F39_04870 [Cloacibacillus sp. An23]